MLCRDFLKRKADTVLPFPRLRADRAMRSEMAPAAAGVFQNGMLQAPVESGKPRFFEARAWAYPLTARWGRRSPAEGSPGFLCLKGVSPYQIQSMNYLREQWRHMSSQKSSSVVFRRFKVFSSKRVALPAQGGAEPSSEQQKKYWLVEAASQGALTIQALDANTWMPVGSTHPITVRELQKRYIPENGLYEQKVRPNLEKFSGNLSLLEAPETEGVVSTVNEADCITNFEEGIGCLAQGEQDKALAIFSGLLNSELPFEEKHKHLFNTFAIRLRKNKLSSQAIAYYTRALELAWGEDENLHINLARVLFDEKQYGGCVQHLFDALRISPEHSVARNFLSWLNTHALIPKQYVLEARALLAQRRPEHLLGEEQSKTDHGEGRKEQEAGSAVRDGGSAVLDDGSPR